MEMKELNLQEQTTIIGGSEAGQAAMYGLGVVCKTVWVFMCFGVDNGIVNFTRFYY
jgi:hypothetical protein